VVQQSYPSRKLTLAESCELTASSYDNHL
jgi:hypothetical protein